MTEDAKTTDGSDPFDEGPPRSVDAERLIVRLESYEGPLDLLLDQARAQKVDLAEISILQLAEQYLEFVETARRLRLDLAAEYLVMAAWLAFLKSRLLLPAEDKKEDEPTAGELAAALAFQLRRLEGMRTAAEALAKQPRLGIEVFARGAPEPFGIKRETVFEASLYDLLSAYGELKRRTTVQHSLRIEASELYTTRDAIAWLTAQIGGLKDWTELHKLLPDIDADPLVRRSAMASALTACLEMTKDGLVTIRQDGPFGTIYVKGGAAVTDAPDEIAPSDDLRLVEALLFASAEPVTDSTLREHLGDAADLGGILAQLEALYRTRGVNLVRVAEGWAFRTAPDLSSRLQRMAVQPRKLSRAAMETLSVIAYHQPMTRAEIESIRGVATSKGTIDLLLETGWIRPGRRRQTPGRPLTWMTTPAFLDHFGLASLDALPGLEELRSAGLLDTRPAIATLPGARLGEGDDEATAADATRNPLVDEEERHADTPLLAPQPVPESSDPPASEG